MVYYSIGILMLIKHLKSIYTDIKHPWYAGDAGELGMFDKFE